MLKNNRVMALNQNLVLESSEELLVPGSGSRPVVLAMLHQPETEPLPVPEPEKMELHLDKQ